MAQYKGTTPTHTFTMPQSVLAGMNIADALNVYVSFADADRTLFTKSGDDVTISKNTVKVRLGQEETLRLPNRVRVQINYTFKVGDLLERNCTDIHTLIYKDNLLKKVIE